MKNFKFDHLYQIEEIIITNAETISTVVKFKYIDYKDDTKCYIINILFENIKTNDNYPVVLRDLFNINKLNIVDFAKEQWGNVNWMIKDEDGNIIFQLYCEEIQLQNLKEIKK